MMNKVYYNASPLPIVIRQRRESGFTLIELVIAIGIVGILTALAVPGYQAYVIKSNRKAAAACLLEQAQRAERYYTTTLTYVGLPAPGGGCTVDLAARYTFPAATSVTATTYIFSANALGDQLRDTQCLNLGVNQAGTKTVSGSYSASPNQCYSN